MGGRAFTGIALAVLLAFVQTGPAKAASPVESFSMTPSSTQAGGHPDLNASISIGSGAPDVVGFFPSEGLVAFPYAVPACSEADLAIGECAPGSQVGVATFYADYEGDGSKLLGTAPVHVVAPDAGDFRELAAQIPVVGATVSGPVSLEYESEEEAVNGYELAFEGFPESVPLRQMDLALWGIPANQAHDSARFPKGTAGCPGLTDTSCIGPTASNLPQTPFIEAPTQCASPAPPSYAFVESGEIADFAEAPYPDTTGCRQISFNPMVSIGELPAAAGASTDVDLELDVPQAQTPVTPSPSEVESLSIDFQDAVEIDAWPATHPVCTDVVPPGDSRCLEETRIGTATFDSPAFPGPLTGGIYLGEVSPPVRIIWVLASGYGTKLQLVFLIRPAVTGPMSLELVNLPQLPLESIDLHFDREEGALFKTGRCGKHTPVAEAIPWDEALDPHVFSLGEYQWDEGLAGPCPYVPARVAVSLEPSRLPADGASVTTATATVTDFYGLPLPDEMVSFSSTDAGQRIGPVKRYVEGTYSSRIVASTLSGTSTITATDVTSAPAVAGEATLVQDAKISDPLPAPVPRLTGRRAAALKKCQEKHRRKARAKCRRHARKLPR